MPCGNKWAQQEKSRVDQLLFHVQAWSINHLDLDNQELKLNELKENNKL